MCWNQILLQIWAILLLILLRPWQIQHHQKSLYIYIYIRRRGRLSHTRVEDQDATTYAYKRSSTSNLCFKISRPKSAEQKIGKCGLQEMWSAHVKATSTILAHTHSHAIKQRKSNRIWEQCLLMIAVMRETRSRDKKHFK